MYIMHSNISKIVPFQHVISIINEIFYIVFLITVFKIQCVFYTYSTFQFRVATSQFPIASCGWWLPY